MRVKGEIRAGSVTLPTIEMSEYNYCEMQKNMQELPSEMRSEARQPTGAFGPGTYSNTSIPEDQITQCM